VELKLEYALSEQADRVVCDGTHRIRIDGRTIAYRGKDIIEALSYLL